MVLDPETFKILMPEVNKNRVRRKVPLRIVNIVLEVYFVPALAYSAVIIEVPFAFLLLIRDYCLHAVDLDILVRILAKSICCPVRNRVLIPPLNNGYRVPLLLGIFVHHQEPQVVNMGVMTGEVEAENGFIEF
jgi:hypothetical protein